MTYLFLVIAMSLLSAVSATSILELTILHALFLIGASLVETILSSPSLLIQEIQYEKIENIKPQNYNLLIEDLKKRTGLNVQSVEIGTIDFLRDTANLRVHHQALSQADMSPHLVKMQLSKSL